MPSFSQPNTGRMAAQAHDTMFRYAGETATVWAYISASGGNAIVGIENATYSAGVRITAQFYVARGFMPGVQQTQSPAGMIPAGSFLMNSEYKPSPNDVIEYQRTAYKVEGEPFREPLMKNNWVSVLKRAGT